jgi:molecular chaperone DnaK (HSP70)
VTHAVIAVPADINKIKIKAIYNAATKSGLTIMRIITNITATEITEKIKKIIPI